MIKNINKEKPLFSIDNNAYILHKIYSISIMFSAILYMIIVLLLTSKYDAIYDFMIIITLPILGVLIYSIQVYSVLKKNDFKIDFFEDRLIDRKNGKTIYLNQINEIYKFKILLNYNGKRFRFSGFFAFFYSFICLFILLLMIYEPKIALILFSSLLFFYIGTIFGNSLYLYITTRKFIFTFQIMMLEIFNSNSVMCFALDNSKDHLKIKSYLKKYINIDLDELNECITFKKGRKNNVIIQR